MKVFKKYIRTKEGIYQQRKPLLDEYIVGNETFVYSHPSIKDRDIIQDADTIVELCDEVVYIKENSVEPERMYPSLMNIQAIIETRKLLGCSEEWLIENFYYGIWTDKGLIYVAKMNDKGELELL